MVQGLLTTVVFFTDRMLLGQYDSVALGSMQISGPVMWSVFTVCGAFGAGTMAVIGRAVGAKDARKTRETTIAVILLAVAIGVGLAIVGWMSRSMIAEALAGHGPNTQIIRALAEQYMGITFLGAPFVMVAIGGITALQATGDTRTPAWITAVGGLLNLTVSWVFIYGHLGAPELGVAGAALGTLTAYSIHGLLCFIALLRAGGPIGGKWSLPPFSKAIRPVLSISGAAFGERFIFHTGFLIFAGLIGRLGDVAMATNQSVIAIESLGFILSSGFSIAAGALVAQKLGAQKPQEAELCGWISAAMAVAVLTLIGLMFWFLPHHLLGFFSQDPKVVALGVDCLRIAAIAQPLMALTDTLAGSLRGAGDTKSPMIISLIGPLFIRLTSCWFFAFELDYGLLGIWIGTTLDWSVRTVLLVVIFKRGKWKTIQV